MFPLFVLSFIIIFLNSRGSTINHFFFAMAPLLGNLDISCKLWDNPFTFHHLNGSLKVERRVRLRNFLIELLASYSFHTPNTSVSGVSKCIHRFSTITGQNNLSSTLFFSNFISSINSQILRCFRECPNACWIKTFSAKQVCFMSFYTIPFI